MWVGKVREFRPWGEIFLRAWIGVLMKGYWGYWILIEHVPLADALPLQ